MQKIEASVETPLRGTLHEPRRQAIAASFGRDRLDSSERRALPDRRQAKRTYASLDLLVAFSALAAVLLAANASSMPRGLTGFLELRLSMKNVILLGILAFSWVHSFEAFGLYQQQIGYDRTQELSRLLAACTIGTIPVFAFPLLTRNTGALHYSGAIAFWFVVTGATIAVRMGLERLHGAGRDAGRRRVIIVGTGPRAVDLARRLRSDAEVRYDILGFVDTREAAMRGAGQPCTLGFLEDFEQTLMHTVVDEVLVALPIKSHYREIERAIRASEAAGVQSKHLADAFTPSLARTRLETSGSLPVVAMPVVHDDYRVVVKRIFDVGAVLCAVPLVLPLCLCIAVAIKTTSAGSILFTQERFGYKKRRFRMYKFRTMVADAESLMPALESRNEAIGPIFKIKDDPRITLAGRWLRRTSLDELPQLWNILRGDMSLVGPRPMSVRDVEGFDRAAAMRRFSVRPGLTGLWQVSGRSNLPFEQWLELDLAYIDGWSLAGDLRILCQTLPAVVRGVGAL